MKKSLYKKFTLTFLAIVLSGFLLLGSLVLVFAGQYWMDNNKKELLLQAGTVAGMIQTGAQVYGGTQLNRYAYQIATVVAGAADCQMLVVNAEGQPVACVGEYVNENTLTPRWVIEFADRSGTVVGTLDGVLDTQCLVAAAPIFVNGGCVGVAYAASPMGQVGAFTRQLLQLLLVAALVVAVLLVVAAYAMASAMVRPLQEMSQAAECLARGDFSRRIAVTRQDEIGQLADAFNRMTLSLEAGEKMRKGFVANVSHELKSPMTTIGGFVNAILDGTVDAAQQQEYLGIIGDEVKRLSRLVNTMLNLAKLESGETVLHPALWDLTESAIHAALMFEPAITQKQLTLAGLEELPRLPAVVDPDLMEQVVFNLMDNAVKYTPPGGTITMSGRVEEGKLIFCLRNTGDGIAEQDLPFVFDRFYKVDRSRGADRNSLGLGLYLVKTIVMLHHGSITVRSVQHAFCEFELQLNAAPVTMPNAAAQPPERSN